MIVTPSLQIPIDLQWILQLKNSLYVRERKKKKTLSAIFLPIFFLVVPDSLRPQHQPLIHCAIPAAVNQRAMIVFDDSVVQRREQQLSLTRNTPSQSVSEPIWANSSQLGG